MIDSKVRERTQRRDGQWKRKKKKVLRMDDSDEDAILKLLYSLMCFLDFKTSDV